MNWLVEKLNREQGASATGAAADQKDDADVGLADRIAAALRTERAAELAAASAPPPATVPEPPAWLFGPRHRELDAQRRAATEAARHAPAAPAAPLPTLEAITGYAVPSTPDATPATRPLCPCCLRPMPAGG